MSSPKPMLMEGAMRRIMVTGGSGFIGTNLISHLSTIEGVEVFNIDTKAPKIDAHGAMWIQCDICDAASLRDAVAKCDPDVVIHLAARTDLRGAAIEDYESNTTGVSNLIGALTGLNGLERVVFASSMYVCRPGYVPEGSEDYAPHTPYGESKVETERRVRQEASGFAWTIVRPTSIWGPWFGEPYDAFFKIVLRRAYFHLGRRACRKTYGYVDNAIAQVMAILAAPTEAVDHKVFYLGDYEPYDITEWADEIAAHEGFGIPRVPFFLFVAAAWLGDVLKAFGVPFPMTSFRLRNMTTDNVHDLTPIRELAPLLPVSRQQGNARTIEWIKGKRP